MIARRSLRSLSNLHIPWELTRRLCFGIYLKA